MEEKIFKGISIFSLIGLLVIGFIFILCNDVEFSDEQQTVVSVGAWPKENNEHELKIYENWKEAYEKENPDVSIVPEPYTYNAKTFVAKAAIGQLPTYFAVPYTEPRKIVQAGYAADITDIVKELGYDKDFNDDFFGNLYC